MEPLTEQAIANFNAGQQAKVKHYTDQGYVVVTVPAGIDLSRAFARSNVSHAFIFHLSEWVAKSDTDTVVKDLIGLAFTSNKDAVRFKMAIN